MVHLTCFSLADFLSFNYTMNCEVKDEFGVRNKDYGGGKSIYNLAIIVKLSTVLKMVLSSHTLEHFTLSKP